MPFRMLQLSSNPIFTVCIGGWFFTIGWKEAKSFKVSCIFVRFIFVCFEWYWNGEAMRELIPQNFNPKRSLLFRFQSIREITSGPSLGPGKNAQAVGTTMLFSVCSCSLIMCVFCAPDWSLIWVSAGWNSNHPSFLCVDQSRPLYQLWSILLHSHQGSS